MYIWMSFAVLLSINLSVYLYMYFCVSIIQSVITMIQSNCYFIATNEGGEGREEGGRNESELRIMK